MKKIMILTYNLGFALSNKSKEESNRIYLITDEIINENCMKISLWKIDPLNECESVNCEKLQSILIKTVGKEFELGDYSFILIDENNFSLYFQDVEMISILILILNSLIQFSFLNQILK